MSASPSRINLIDEAWIPVRKLNGERAELGIRDTLLRAKEIAAIEDDSPLLPARRALPRTGRADGHRSSESLVQLGIACGSDRRVSRTLAEPVLVVR